MKYYRFWLEELNPATAEILIKDPEVTKYYFVKDKYATQFQHGDCQDWGKLLMNRPCRDPGKEISTLPPTAVEVPGNWPMLDWLLLQVTLLEKNPAKTAQILTNEQHHQDKALVLPTTK